MAYGRFQSPPSEAGPLPLWFWNGRLDGGALRRQLAKIHEAGCAGAIICPRHGLRTPYLSDEWMRLVSEALDEGRSRGLSLWLADSAAYPGGVPPGESSAHYVRAAVFRARGVLQEIFPLTGDLLSVRACQRQDGKCARLGDSLDLAEFVHDGILTWRPEGGDWEILSVSSFPYPHADLMAAGAGQRLLESTHARYECALGPLADAGLAGFYTDDLALLSIWDLPDGASALPWTAALGDGLTRDLGCSLSELMAAVCGEFEESPRARQRFFESVICQCEQHFLQPVQQWLHSRGLRWAGNVLFEEPLSEQVATQGDILRLLSYYDLPVVDNQQMQNPGPEVDLVSSVLGDAGVEAFGGSGWGTPLDAREKLYDRAAARGATRLLPHAAFFSAAGKRKLDSPPGDILREPYAALYARFSDHIRRVHQALSEGRSTPSVALFYPARSAWSLFCLSAPSAFAQAVEEDFYRVCSHLEELQYEYRPVDERALESAEIVGDRIRISGDDYPILAFPSTPFISRASWDRVQEFLEEGGKVAFLGMLPEGFEDGPDADLQDLLLRLTAVEVETVRQAYLSQERAGLGGQEVYNFTFKTAGGGRFSAFPAGLSTDLTFARGEIRQILNSFFPPDVECRDRDVHTRRRACGGLDLYWILSTAAAPLDTRLGLRSHGAPEIWDTYTGERKPLWQYTWVDADQTVVTIRLQPGEGVLIAVPAEENEHVEAANFVLTEVAAIEDQNIVEGYDDPRAAVRATTRLTGDPQCIIKRSGKPVSLAGESAPPLAPLNLADGWQLKRDGLNVLVLGEWRYRRDDRGGGRILQWHRRLHGDWDVLPARQPLTWRPLPEPLEQDLSSFAWYQSDFNVQNWESDRELWLVFEEIDTPLRYWVDGEEVTPRGPGIPGSAGVQPLRADVLNDPGYLWLDLRGRISTGHHTVTLFADYRSLPVSSPTHRNRIPIDLVPGRARLCGDFWVLERARGRSIITREPQPVSLGSMADWGCPHYSGPVTLTRELRLPDSWEGVETFLELQDLRGGVEILLDGSVLARTYHTQERFALTGKLNSDRASLLELRLWNTSGPTVTAEPDGSGIAGMRLLAFPRVTLAG